MRSMQSEAFDFMSNMVMDIGTSAFHHGFYRRCRDVFRNDQCNVFVFRPGEAPACVLSMANDAEMRELTHRCASDYTRFGYKSDPTLRVLRAQSGLKSRAAVRVLSRGEINNIDYRSHFYDRAGVRQKLAVCARQDGKLFYLNLYRNPDQADFVGADRMLFTDVAGLLVSMLARHEMLVAPPPRLSANTEALSVDLRGDLRERLKAALLSESAGLTAKEADVCAAIALGVSTEGIGLELGISVNTVATHRKRAYAKLGISSQNQLFARYYESLTRYMTWSGPQEDQERRRH